MTWDQLRTEIAQALGKKTDEVPQPGTQEFNRTLGLLLDAHPDIAARVQTWLVQSTEPVASQAEIAREARAAEVRQRLASLFTKHDHTQPHRRRLNKPVVLAAVFCGIALLWFAGRLHSPSVQVREAHVARPRPAASQPRLSPLPSQQPQATPPLPSQQPQAQATPSQTAQPPRPAAPAPVGPQPQAAGPSLPSLPPPPLPSGPAQAPPAAQTSSGGTSVVGAQGQQAPQGVQVVVGAASQTAGTTIVTAAAQASGAAPAGSQQGGTTVVAPSAEGQGSTAAAASPQPSARAPAGASASATPRFQIGDQFTVTLKTPLAVSPAWQALPAVAQAEDGPIAGWQVMGSATQGQDGSLQITWTQALSPDRKTTIQLHGVAYDPKVGKPGVPGAASSVMAPQAARTALAGALGAVSQYVQDQIQAQQIQVSGITGVITSQVPPFWQVLAQQLATGFQPAPVQTGGTIMVTRVPAGTPVVVFITATGS